MPQSGAQSKKPRTGRGFRQLPFAYIQLEVNVLAVLLGFEHSVHLSNFWVSVDTLYLPLTPLIYTITNRLYYFGHKNMKFQIIFELLI
jgi:hypothetical protein